jgi:hypothetical protein
MDKEDALSLEGQVVHHGTPDTFGIEFHNTSSVSESGIRALIKRLHQSL